MDVKMSSTLCGVAGVSPATRSYEQLVASWKSKWHSDAGAIGLKLELFHKSEITSKTVGGLKEAHNKKIKQVRVSSNCRSNNKHQALKHSPTPDTLT